MLSLTLTRAWQKNGFDLSEEDDSLKKKFTFNKNE